jgi:hypothetical protein
MNMVAIGSGKARTTASLGKALARADPRAVWAVLGLRTFLAVAFQSSLAVIFLMAGSADPWRAAADWWLAWFAAVSAVNLVVIRALLHAEGRRLRDLYRFEAIGRSTDLKWVAIALGISVPLTVVPNLLVSQALWGSGDFAAALTFRPLPLVGAAVLVVAFPILHALAELPTYFGYVMPRLEAITGWRWRSMLVSALVLSTQHVALPLLFDWRFLAWRALLFLPFAVWIGFVLRRRPTTLPYLVIGHAVLDASLPIIVLVASL